MRYLRVYEWSPRPTRRQAGVIPLVAVNLFHEDNIEQIEPAVAELARRRQGERALMPFWVLTKQLRQHIPELPRRPDLDWLTIFENGIETQSTIEWLRPLGDRLRQRGIWLDLIAADCEDGVTTWDILGGWDPDAWEQKLGRIYNSPAAFARLPQDLKRLRPRDYNPWTEPGRDAIVRFNYYAKELVMEAFRKIFIESKVFDDTRGRKRFRLCNWWDIRPSFPITDYNRWPISGLATDGISAWSGYLSEGGGLYANTQHARLWNVFIYQLNIARSCVATRGATAMPWLSSPRFFERENAEGAVERGYDNKNVWMWNEMVAHMVRAGVREFLLWNDDTDLELAMRLVTETMRANDKPYSARRLDKIEFDVDEVTTRGYTTRYTDFLAAMR